MIKKQQKWIALLVVCTFMWLMQVSTMPVAAAGTTEQISSASADQAPGFIEEDGPSKSKAKKKSMLPIILIGVGLVAVTVAVLILVVFKTKYDIVGTWDCNFTGSSGLDFFKITFSGDKKSGTWKLTGWTDTGTYTVDGKKVTFRFDEEPWIFTGEFTDKDKMSGNHVWSAIGISGTWTATRAAGTSSTKYIQATKSLAAKIREMRLINH